MQHLQTPNVSKGTNTKRFIIVHHTGSNNASGTIAWFQNPQSRASAHYVVAPDGAITKFNDHNAILRHAGISAWQGLTDLNRHSIGIEVVGIDTFTQQQKIATRHLINTIMKQENIPHTHILRHAHIAPGRKTDINLNFVAPLTWQQYQESFISHTTMTEQQYKLKIQASMLDHSLQHQLAERIQNEKKRKEIQECLARINALYRELGFDRP